MGRVEAGCGAELVARPPRLPVEPVVVGGGAGDDDALRPDAVKLDRLALLEVVPHEYLVGRVTQQPLVGQVVPAAHRERDGDAEPLRGAHEVGLVRAEADQRRDQQHVGALVPQERQSPRRRVDAALHALQDAPRRRRAARNRPHRAPQPSTGRRSLRLGPSTQLRRVAVDRLEVAQVVDRPTERPGQVAPARLADERMLDDGDPRAGGDELGHLRLRLRRLDVPAGDTDLVAALGQQPDDGRKRPQVGGVLDDEKDGHRCSPVRNDGPQAKW